ncbi:hypothetical protein L7F22_012014 [Adiantum nelumboides]|nr:hypothetical protein [Adiantum nelumboides]
MGPSSEANFEIKACLYQDFEEAPKAWTGHASVLEVHIPVQDLMDPLAQYAMNAIILFFPKKMSIVEDVGQWVDYLLKHQAIRGVYFGARGFYEVLMADTEARNHLLKMSPLFFNTQMTHVLPWALTKDYQTLIRHKCSFGWKLWTFLGKEPDQYILSLCNSFGQSVAFNKTSVEPQFIAMNRDFVFVSSDSAVSSWNYRSSLHRSSTEKVISNKSAIDHSLTFHLDRHVRLAPFQENDDGTKQTADQISCICSSHLYLMVGRDSGILHRFTLPQLNLENTDLLQCRPQAMELNCTSTRLAVIDMNGILRFYDVKVATQSKHEV